MHKFKNEIKTILNKKNSSVESLFFELNSFYENLNDKDKFEFIDSLWFVFRNSVHNISDNTYNNLHFIKSILYFYENSKIKNSFLDSNDIICFSFPLRHQVYTQDCYFSKSFIEMYALFFDDKNVFLNKNKHLLDMTISEIKGFIEYAFNKNINEINKFFSNKTIFNYFYENQKDWLKENSRKCNFSIIKNKFIIEEF